MTPFQTARLADSLSVDSELAIEGISLAPMTVRQSLIKQRPLFNPPDTSREGNLSWNDFYSFLRISKGGFKPEREKLYRNIIAPLRADPIFSHEEQCRWSEQMSKIEIFVNEAVTQFSNYIGRPPENTWDISAVGDLHQSGMVTLRMETDEGVFFLKKRPYNHYEFLKNILVKAGVKFVFLPEAERCEQFIIEKELVGRRCDSSTLKQAVLELEAFSYALGIDDLHFENVLETDKGLAILDYETYLNPILQARHGGTYVKNMTVLSNLFSKRGFRRPTLNGLHNRYIFEPRVDGITVLSYIPDISMSDCYEVMSIGSALLDVLFEQEEWPENQFIRTLLDPTKTMVSNVEYFSKADSPGSTLAERWVALYASSVFDVPFYDPAYFARLSTCALQGFIPCFYHAPKSTLLAVDTSGTSAGLRNLPICGYEAAQMRRRHHERNLIFNVRHLFFMYNQCEPD